MRADLAYRFPAQNCTGVLSPDSQRVLGTDGAGIVRVWYIETTQRLWSFEQEGLERGCRRYVDCSAYGRYIIIVGAILGRMLVFDKQHRIIGGVIVQTNPSRGAQQEHPPFPFQPIKGEVLGVTVFESIPVAGR
jgi:hypothetical protein